MIDIPNKSLARVIDELDAFVFTSDALRDSQTQRVMKRFLKRWGDEIDAIRRDMASEATKK